MKKNDLLILLISIFIFVIVWTGFSIYHNLATSTIPEALNVQIAPITANFDTKTIANLKKRQEITPLYQLNPKTENITTPATQSANTVSLFPLVGTSSAQQATSGGVLSQ